MCAETEREVAKEQRSLSIPRARATEGEVAEMWYRGPTPIGVGMMGAEGADAPEAAAYTPAAAKPMRRLPFTPTAPT
jgi:hypothetical protein